MEKRQIPIIALAVFSITLFPLFNNAYADTTVIYNNIVDNSGRAICADVAICNSAVIFDGEEFTSTSSLIGQSFNRMDIKLSKSSTLPYTGSVYIGVWDSTIAPDSSNYKRLIAVIDPNTLPTSATYYNLTLSTAYTIQSNDAIGVLYPFDPSNISVSTRFSTSSQVNGTQTRETYYNSIGWNDVTTNDITMRLYLFTSSGVSGNIINGVDCGLPENESKLICVMGQTGSIQGSAGAFVIGDVENGTGMLGLGCGIGIVDCSSDTDPKTNGLGLLIFIASIFVVVGIFFYSIGKEVFHMPIFIWIVIIISLSAFFTITGLIDPVFLILSVIAIIALAVPKVMTIVRGNSSFGGGSTE